MKMCPLIPPSIGPPTVQTDNTYLHTTDGMMNSHRLSGHQPAHRGSSPSCWDIPTWNLSDPNTDRLSLPPPPPTPLLAGLISPPGSTLIDTLPSSAPLRPPLAATGSLTEAHSITPRHRRPTPTPTPVIARFPLAADVVPLSWPGLIASSRSVTDVSLTADPSLQSTPTPASACAKTSSDSFFAKSGLPPFSRVPAGVAAPPPSSASSRRPIRLRTKRIASRWKVTCGRLTFTSIVVGTRTSATALPLAWKGPRAW
mmetsp:Transcript_43686/g.123763  ORF Transcript_43686/g.123763 Transcript_43686/m.123763 type:complete len:256 (+) Transcript_43686:1117-1884(+)